MNTIRTATTITTLGLVAMIMAGCASGTSTASVPNEERDAPSVSELRLGYFANVTHAPALVGLEEGLFADALGDVKVTTSGLQRRSRRDRGPHRRCDRRHLHRPQPLDQHLHPVGRRVGAHHRRRRHGWRGARRRRRDRQPGRPRGDDTRVAAAGQHAGCRAARLARRPGLHDRHVGRRRRQHHPDRERADPHALPAGRPRRRVAARAVGLAPHHRRRRPRPSGRGRAVAGRRVPDDGPARAGRVPR